MNKFYITHLYPNQMSIYGDMGNILTLTRKLKKLGFEVVYQTVNLDEELPIKTDFYFMGGGQDNDQYRIFQDLLTKKTKLIEDVNNGVGLMSICGGYQLLGQSFVTGEGKSIEGIGLFPVSTKSLDASVKSRCIGNIVVELSIPELKGQSIVGFENHGGQTFINDLRKASYIGKTIVGYGNNFEEGFEGCIYLNAIGTYLHGSCLPKNPNLANWLIQKSIETKSKLEGVQYQLNFTVIDDTIALQTQTNLIKRWTTKK
jgi:lipid II isoglutaminyl synthase (glutamine-hydrolysing)